MIVICSCEGANDPFDYPEMNLELRCKRNVKGAITRPVQEVRTQRIALSGRAGVARTSCQGELSSVCHVEYVYCVVRCNDLFPNSKSKFRYL